MPDVTQLRTQQQNDFNSDLDEIAREGARRMLAQALEAEVADYIAQPGTRRGRPGEGRPSPFATVRLRQRVTKGAGSRQKGLLMAFELLAMAERRWRRINGAEKVPIVRAGVRFRDGLAVERHPSASCAA